MKRPAGPILPLLGAPGPQTAAPLHRRIYERIRDAVLDGALAPGRRLPSARTLADELAVSRNTVETALAQLEAEGFLVRRVGAGTFVADAIPEHQRRPRRPARAALPATASASASAPASAAAPALSRRGRGLVGAALETEGTAPRAFAPCVSDVGEFPHRLWARFLARHARCGLLVRTDDPAGYVPLRQAVAAHLQASRGVRCDWRQVVVLTSTQQALDLAARLLLDPGETAWLENPGYLGARAALASAGAQIVPVPVDDDGLDVAAGRAAAPQARLAYVTPSHQYPLGGAMSLGRRLALLAWAAEAGSWIVEDDYDSEFHYDGRPLTAMQGIDAGGRVLYAGTFNKVMFPALRLAYVVAPPPLAEALAAARTLSDGAAPLQTQAALADFIERGHFATHLRTLRARYRERRDALRDAVARHLGGTVRLGPSGTGMHVVGYLPDGTDASDASRRALARGLDLPPLERYTIGAPPLPALVFGYAGLTPEAIEAGVRELAGVLGCRGVRGVGRG